MALSSAAATLGGNVGAVSVFTRTKGTEPFVKLSEVGAHPIGELHGTLDRLGLKSLSLDADRQRGGGEVAEDEVGEVDTLAHEVREALGELVTSSCRLEKNAVVHLVLPERRVVIVKCLCPPAQDSAVYYTPSMHQRYMQHTSKTPGSAPVCVDVFVEQRLMPPAEHCWTDLVGLDPVVIVGGFPIPRRPETYPGLKISSKILRMAGYISTVVIEREGISLRAPERILVLVKRRDNVLFWGDVDDPECRRDDKCVADAFHLDYTRHVLGPRGNISRGARPGRIDSVAGPSDSESGRTRTI